ncbi:serine hydrolase domain-containing protein [Phenylobacterium ferrooxidans]|uniref:Beta-lactamase family protein n=1 Tax=Phenylobacterium ferrooxidans TaxID=2982689 RepID=A0ABW6CHU5_9CAUL
MNSVAKAAFAALLLLAAPAIAQDAAAPPATSATPTAANPQGPVPYETLRRPVRPAARSVARPAAAAPASAAATAAPTSSLTTIAPAAPLAASGARLAPGQPLPPAELEAYVDGVVKDAMDREHIAGVTVSVIQDGQVVLKKGYGFASLSPARRVNPDTTLFRVGSISKTFTWIALMKEVEADRIRLGQPINLYLPEQLQVKDQGFHTPIRVRNLLDHSTGFEDRALGQLFEKNPSRERSLAAYLRQERPRRVHTPGAVASYSNYGAALAGQAVSYASGKPFERLIEEEIFLPLKMNHTTFREARPTEAGLPAPMPDALQDDLSEGYRWTPTGYSARPYEYIGHIGPAGSVSSTAGDMARYMQMLLNGGSLDGAAIYGPRTAKAFATPLRRTAPGINGWLHGFATYDLPGGHQGFGHSGGTLSFLSNMVVAPDLKLGVFISTNTETGGDLVTRLPERIVAQFYAPPMPFPRKGVPALVDNRKAYEGYYLGTRRAYRGLESFVGKLISGVSVSVTDDGRLVTSGGMGDPARSWVPEGDPLSGRFISTTGAERLSFEVADGKAVSFSRATGASTFERTGFWNRPTTLLILGVLTALASAATLGGVLLRNRREFRETGIQSRASLIQNIQAALWLTSMVLLLVWASKTSDLANIMYGWPGATLVIASACAFVATLLTAGTLLMAPAVWRGGRRVDSWTQARKAGFTFTVLLYTAFCVVLGLWGALAPWGG